MKKYWKFLLMIGVSTVIMFGMMYLNVYSIDHLFFSRTRVFMALMMGAVMAIIMLLFMWKMYENKTLNKIILGVSVLVFAGSLFMVRSQTTVSDVAWMKAMIPHHSIAILTSKRANLKDPEVKKLANDIIEAQEKEIEQMKKLIEEQKKVYRKKKRPKHCCFERFFDSNIPRVYSFVSIPSVPFGFSSIFSIPNPVKALTIEKTGESKLKKTNGKYVRVGIPKVLATKLPAIPQGTR